MGHPSEQPEVHPEPSITVVRPDRPGVRMVLGDLEAEIMEVLWARAEGQGTTVREVFETLYARRRIAYTTIMTTMARLARKGLLRADKVDHSYVYRPTSTQEEFVSRFVGRLLESLLVNFSGPALAALEEPGVSERAQRLLEEIARRRAAEESGAAEEGA